MAHSSTATKPPKVVQAGPADRSRELQPPNTGKHQKDRKSGPGTIQPSHTPPSSPVPDDRGPNVTLAWADLLRIIKELSPLTSDLAQEQSDQQTNATSVSSAAEKAQTDKKRASKLSYLKLREIWDKEAYKYKTFEASTREELNHHDEYLFVVRDRVDRRTEKAVKFIDIKSEAIRDMLRLVLKDVRVVSLKEDKPSIEQNILFNFLEGITKYCTGKLGIYSQDEIASKHLDIFLDYLQTEYGTLKTRLNSLLKAKEITYDLLWTIFKPNAEIFTTCSGTGVPRCVRCRFGEERKRSNGTIYFHVECHYLDFDGETFGEATKVLAIDEFRGAKPINLLPSYPLIYHRQSSEMKKQLIDYGRKFISLLGVHHRTYEGKAFHIDKEGNIVTTFVRGSRIMVDPSFFFKRNPNYRRAKVEPSSNDEGDCIHEIDSLFTYTGSTKKEKALQPAGKDPKQISEEDLLICTSTVCGFSLYLKMWLEFAVAFIGEIKWDNTCFDRLALPVKTIKVIKALCNARLSRDRDLCFEDFVVGKGRGLITLLHGPPGVGKTLTAETTSEYARRPFYTVSAGELGTNATDLERNLSNIFELSSHWKAALLFDEADVFVERRSNSDVYRNALVSVFLRKLEYYEGVLFLTTNRVQTIDDAFASRIHLPLRYDLLSESDRKKVWQGHLEKAITPHGKAECTPKDLDELARMRLNGREITNATSTAQALAAFDNTVVKLTHLMDAISTSEQFQTDFKGAGHFANQGSYL